MAQNLFLSLALVVLFSYPGKQLSLIEIEANSAQARFPSSIAFNLSARSSTPIQTIYLHYGAVERTCLSQAGMRQSMKFEAAPEVAVQWVWDLNKYGGVPPGTKIWWQWELYDQNGKSRTTSRETLIFEDTRFHWEKAEKNGVNLYWWKGDRTFGTRLTDLAVDSLDRLEDETGISLADVIRLTVYPSAQDILNAGLNLPEWSGGAAYPEYGSIVIGIAPGQDAWAAEVIPHELAHLVIGEKVFNCRGMTLPTWLNEGFSVYMEGMAPVDDLDRLQVALESGRLPALNSLSAGFAKNSETADLSYIFSGQVVGFMLDTYGSEKMEKLLANIRDGETANAALQEVYGLDTDGLEEAWRYSSGFTVLKSTASIRVAQTSTPVPTLPLWTPAFENRSASSGPLPSKSPSRTLQPSPNTPATPTLADSTLTYPVSMPTVPQSGNSFQLDLWPPMTIVGMFILIVLVWFIVKKGRS